LIVSFFIDHQPSGIKEVFRLGTVPAQTTGSPAASFRVKDIGNRLKRALMAAFFPEKCLVCGSFFHPEPLCGMNEPDKRSGEMPFCFSSAEEAFKEVMAPHICRECMTDFRAIGSPMCVKCGMMFEAESAEDHYCGYCIQSPKAYGKARAIGVFDGTCMELVHAYKYRGKIQLAQPLGMLLLYAFIHYWRGTGIDCIVPIPLHPNRFKQRGFNQVYLLVRNWSRYLYQLNPNFRGTGQFHINRNDLIRNRETIPQTGLGKRQREANVDGAFKIRDPAAITGKSILLVDDVYTTGATVEACTKVLLNNGALKVDVLTLARAM